MLIHILEANEEKLVLLRDAPLKENARALGLEIRSCRVKDGEVLRYYHSANNPGLLLSVPQTTLNPYLVAQQAFEQMGLVVGFATYGEGLKKGFGFQILHLNTGRKQGWFIPRDWDLVKNARLGDPNELKITNPLGYNSELLAHMAWTCVCQCLNTGDYREHYLRARDIVMETRGTQENE